MNTPNFASRNHSGVGRWSSDAQLGSYFFAVPAAETANGNAVWDSGKRRGSG